MAQDACPTLDFPDCSSWYFTPISSQLGTGKVINAAGPIDVDEDDDGPMNVPPRMSMATGVGVNRNIPFPSAIAAVVVFRGQWTTSPSAKSPFTDLLYGLSLLNMLSASADGCRMSMNPSTGADPRMCAVDQLAIVITKWLVLARQAMHNARTSTSAGAQSAGGAAADARESLRRARAAGAQQRRRCTRGACALRAPGGGDAMGRSTTNSLYGESFSAPRDHSSLSFRQELAPQLRPGMGVALAAAYESVGGVSGAAKRENAKQRTRTALMSVGVQRLRASGVAGVRAAGGTERGTSSFGPCRHLRAGNDALMTAPCEYTSLKLGGVLTWSQVYSRPGPARTPLLVADTRSSTVGCECCGCLRIKIWLAKPKPRHRLVFLMDPSQGIPREYLLQAIDAEIKSLEGSIRGLKHRRNALAPISSLPTEVVATIFSFLRVPRASSPFTLGKKPDHLAWLRVAHVCHQWREIALDQPHFWSHVDFATFSSAGAAEILARAKTVPLHLEARVPIGHWDDIRFSAFQKELQDCLSRICHLSISAEPIHLHNTLKGLVSPAPTLEYLSLSREVYPNIITIQRVFIPDTLFDGSTPRLSCLELGNCDFNWTSPLFKNLKHLEIRKVSPRPKLADWLDALDGMPQLKTLSLHWASPHAPPGAAFPFDIERTVTLPNLTHLDISASVANSAFALAHLFLPALTSLCLTARSCRWGDDIQGIFPYVARHAHVPGDTQPLQSVLICGELTRVDILAWTVPDIDVGVHDRITLRRATPSARVAFSVTRKTLLTPRNYMGIFNAAMAALPLDSLVTLTVQKHTWLDAQSWLRHVPRWPLLQRVRLAPSAARGFREMLLEDNGRSEGPLLPSLTKLVLVNTELNAPRTLHLYDALMKRVEQRVPLETLDLRACHATNRVVELLSEIVVDVLSPEETPETRAQMLSMKDSAARGLFVEDDSSGIEDYDEDDPDADSDDMEWENWGIDDDEEIW
ncbi:hypothetical protein BJY52DRAFT_1418220 [Lactarius psammicola]|nr:hypothetical protein BJY52DRAFT_1418220 [Lactarius psammicola]